MLGTKANFEVSASLNKGVLISLWVIGSCLFIHGSYQVEGRLMTTGSLRFTMLTKVCQGVFKKLATMSTSKVTRDWSNRLSRFSTACSCSCFILSWSYYISNSEIKEMHSRRLKAARQLTATMSLKGLLLKMRSWFFYSGVQDLLFLFLAIYSP